MDEAVWNQRLRILLTGKSLIAYDIARPNLTGDYQQLREAMLQQLGVTLQATRKQLWSFRARQGDSQTATIQRLSLLIKRLQRNLKKPEDIFDEVFYGVYANTITPERALYLSRQDPKSWLETAQIMTEYYSVRSAHQ